GPRTRFGEALAVAIGAVEDAREERALLLVGAVDDDGRRDERLAHAPVDAGIAGGGELVGDDAVLEAVEAAAAVLLGPVRTDPAAFDEASLPLGGGLGASGPPHHRREALHLLDAVLVEPRPDLGAELVVGDGGCHRSSPRRRSGCADTFLARPSRWRSGGGGGTRNGPHCSRRGARTVARYSWCVREGRWTSPSAHRDR